jgi:hypothetical protein
VSANDHIDERLLGLGQILASSRTSTPAAGGDVDVGDVMLASVMTDRIRGTSAELQRGTTIDAATAVAMRLLLSDYSTAVAHLRTVARATDHRLNSVAETIRKGVRAVEKIRNRT